MTVRGLLLGAVLAVTALGTGLGGAVIAQADGTQTATLNSRLSGDLTVHDPVITREGDTYYVFSTIGRYVGIKTSQDLQHWTDSGSVFAEIPAWAKKAIPGTHGIWAPDISYVNGEYRLYYSVSTFGSNRSAIGLATNATLDPKARNYRWKDHGLVVMSTKDSDFNAIDPNLIVDAQGRQWLALGSFWSGIKLFRLDPQTGKPAPGAEPYSIARRLVPAGAPDPIEAPFIFRHDGWYYLLTSFDYCCKGVNSTYYTVVSRSRKITGPYRGKDGSEAMMGGGTIFLRADLQEQQRFRGPGHAGVFTDTDGTTYVVYHAYDKQADGAPKLRIAPIRWGADGWPVAEY
ncbi:arabinan endo-1,5-alpha-L-arabinosidase [Novosphingobium beihaiensis]|uniref:Extracellular exo-alpha-(1->5)-L-arabinofuranosidase n=1 Tax=Novosphingobium beihaiensis TaxID=2930389 RepID=A0ABT0BQ43_9SPHN|nr:arabinan endo-1,5-alpha-L-arabinosidase [Novosphingobium beihaiensis]MCJ2187187.1 arabinan endo-1,5-alpha-L-arabinosidase [Novosphingobium beihaiensis]